MPDLRLCVCHGNAMSSALCLESLISWVYYMSLERCQCSNQLLFHERQEAEVGRTWHFAFKVAKWDVCRSERCTGLTAEAGASRVDPRDVLFRYGIEAIMGLDCELDAS